MKRALVLLLFLAFPAFAVAEEPPADDPDPAPVEEQQNSATDKADLEGFYAGETVKPRKHSEISPMKEHLKTKNREITGLEKNKTQFKKRVENELFLLRTK